MKKFEFTLPDSNNVFAFNVGFLRTFDKHKEMFYDDFDITSFYGSPMTCIWNGNRVLSDDVTKEDLNTFKTRVSIYRDFGAHYRATFSNTLLKEHHLKDDYGNRIASYLNSFKDNGVITSTDIMENYIKENYENLYIVDSVSRCYSNIEDINRSSKDKISVLLMDFNRNENILDKLENPSNIEILVNETECITNCPYRKIHYMHNNMYSLGLMKEIQVNCLALKDGIKPSHEHIIDRDEFGLYSSRGIFRIKIQGRNNIFSASNGAINYLVRKEFREEASRLIKEEEELFRKKYSF